MVRSVCVGALLMWVLTPSGAVAWPPELSTCAVPEVVGAAPGRQQGPVSPYVDPATGAALTLQRHGNGAVGLKAVAGGLEVTKVVTPAGTFDLRLTTPDDAVRIVVNRNRLSVSRGRKKAALDADAVDDLSLPRIQVVLAGSSAVRQFRQIYAALHDETRGRPEGAALGLVEALIGWLQGDVEAIRRTGLRAPGGSPRTLSALSAEGGEELSCYEKWEGEVIDAWDDYEACVLSFQWWNPAREVCAFLWVIRVESAWFSLIGCSAIPIKMDLP
ncbi:MAG: hypothetical protein AB1806_06010 [Acidobacteriota bacterium]